MAHGRRVAPTGRLKPLGSREGGDRELEKSQPVSLMADEQFPPECDFEKAFCTIKFNQLRNCIDHKKLISKRIEEKAARRNGFSSCKKLHVVEKICVILEC